jgi:hypothetical protein
MTKDEIIEMAKQSGAMFDHMTWLERDLLPVFERFAKLVIEHERGKYKKLYEEEIRSIREAATQYGIPSEDAAGMLLFCEEFARMVAEKERDACANECEKIALGFTKWPSAFEGITAETKLMRSLGEFVHKPFTEAIRARGQA